MKPDHKRPTSKEGGQNKVEEDLPEARWRQGVRGSDSAQQRFTVPTSPAKRAR